MFTIVIVIFYLFLRVVVDVFENETDHKLFAIWDIESVGVNSKEISKYIKILKMI